MDSTERIRSWSQERELKDVVWLAKLLGVSRSWVYHAVETGQLPAVRIGALIRFDKRAVAAWIDEQQRTRG